MDKMHPRLQRCAVGVQDVVESNEVGYAARAVTDPVWSSGVVSSGEGGFLVSDSLTEVPMVYHLQTVHRRMQQVPPDAPESKRLGSHGPSVHIRCSVDMAYVAPVEAEAEGPYEVQPACAPGWMWQPVVRASTRWTGVRHGVSQLLQLLTGYVRDLL